jgi:hypothetical protein
MQIIIIIIIIIFVICNIRNPLNPPGGLRVGALEKNNDPDAGGLRQIIFSQNSHACQNDMFKTPVT